MDITKFLIFCSILYVVHFLSSLLGVFILDKLDMSGVVYFDLKPSSKRMAVCSLVELLPPMLLFYILPFAFTFQSAHYITIAMVCTYFALFYVTTRTAYLGIINQEIIILGLTNIFVIAVLGKVIMKVIL